MLHLQMEIDANIERGMSPDEARSLARREFGNPARLRESAHETWVFHWLESILQDIRYATAADSGRPRALSLAVVASLAIGLGCQYRHFRFDRSSRPASASCARIRTHWFNWNGVTTRMPARASMNCGSMSGTRNAENQQSAKGGGRVQLPCVSQQLFRAFAARQSGFVGLVGTGNPREVAISTTAGTSAEQVRFLHVSWNFFDGTRCSTRRLGGPLSKRKTGRRAEPVIVVSHRFWSSRLGRDPGRDRPFRSRSTTSPHGLSASRLQGFFGLVPGEWIDVFRAAGQPTASARSRRIAGEILGRWTMVARP